MGANMARHLQLDCGHDVTAVYDINKEISAALAEELSAENCSTLAGVTAAADVIITVITNDDAMRAIYFSEGDNLLQEASGKTFINCATLSPAAHQEAYEAGKQAGAAVLEGAMASSISHAREGNLYLMIGGDEEVFDSNRALLDDLSLNLRYCGAAGQAAKVKALVNMVMNINTAGLAEGLGLGEALGIDLKVLMKVFSQTGANSRVLETDGDDMVARDHECYFSAAHAAKDSGIALGLAKDAGVNAPLASAAKGQFDRLKRIGLGELDKSGVAELTFPGRKGTKKKS